MEQHKRVNKKEYNTRTTHTSESTRRFNTINKSVRNNAAAAVVLLIVYDTFNDAQQTTKTTTRIIPAFVGKTMMILN